MSLPKLLLTFQIKGEREVRVEPATRIKIDGRGYLVVYGPSATPRKIAIGSMRAFDIRGYPGPGHRAQYKISLPLPVKPARSSFSVAEGF